MPNYFTVPIHVDAIVIDHAREVVGPSADIARSPWVGLDHKGNTRDHHSNTANVAAAIRHDPMTPHSRFLQHGTHLHWALPDRITRGTTTNPEHRSFIERKGLWFPQAPNRWLVTRAAVRSQDVQATWLVESDYVHAWGEGHDAVAYPVPPSTNWPYPYARVGRITKLGDEGEFPTSRRTTLRTLDAPLTAVGPADPSFAALYTACHSIFGAYDPSTETTAVRYSVMGWYSSTDDDPISIWQKAEGRSKEAVARVLASAIDIADDRPTPESITDLPAATKQAQEILFSRRTGWISADPKTSVVDCDGLLFVGSIDVDRRTESTVPAPVSSTVSVGTSPREATSALLAFDYGKPELETELEAIAFGLELADHHLDVGPKLQEFRHSAGFHPVGQKVLWEFRPAAGATSNPLTSPSAAPSQTRTAPLPLELAHQLNHLNVAQDALVEAEEHLEWSRQVLFSDWQLYMLAAYPHDDEATFPVDIDALRDVVVPQAMERCRSDEAVLGLRQIEAQAQHNALALALATHNQSPGVTTPLELAASSGPRYWRPNDPSIAIDHADALVPTKRHAADHRTRSDGNVECLIAALPHPDDFAFSDALTKILDHLWNLSTKPFNAIARGKPKGEVWNPILVEWQGSIAPALAGSNQRASAGQFDPELIASGFALGEDDCDLEPNGGSLGTLGKPYFVSGRSLLTGHGPEIVLSRVRDYLKRVDQDLEAETERDDEITTRVAAIDKSLADATLRRSDKAPLRVEKTRLTAEQGALQAAMVDLQGLRHHYDAMADDLDGRVALGSATNIVSFSLGGVMNRLLMLRDEPQLPIADPLGFPKDEDVAAQVRDLVADARELFTPEPRAPFLPLTTAELSLFDGRIIDTFGQFVKWTPKGDPATGRHVIAAESMSDVHGNAILRPRSAQGARLNFRWLSARRNDVESNDHPAASPLCGWLVPNDADTSVMIYDAAGAMLGMVDEHSVWHPAPGIDQAPVGPGLIDNRHLRRVAQWLVSRPDSSFTESFLSVADSALRTIDPHDYAGHGSRALLVGRPIAVARAQVSLGLQGRPSVDNSLAALALRIEGHDPGDHGFGSIEFPIRIGEHGQYNDGLVGYFVDSGDETNHDVLFSPQSASLPRSLQSDSLVIYDEAAQVPLNLKRSFDDPPIQLTMLLDPRCPVHATTGILPTKSVRIPRDQYEPSMKDLQMMFSAMPVLTGAEEIDLPLPSEPDHRWSWVAIDGGHWSDTPSTPTVVLDDLRSALPGRVAVAADGTISDLASGRDPSAGLVAERKADLLWTKLIDDGWLVWQSAGRAQLGKKATTTLGPGLTAEQVGALLSKVARRIAPAERSAVLRPRGILREGWLKLTPTRSRHPDEIPDHAPPPPAEPVSS